MNTPASKWRKVMPKFLKIIIIIFSTITVLSGQVQKGKIAGQIIDGRSLQPLIGANIIISETQLGAATDEEGFFMISNLAPASYNLEIIYLGYNTI